MAESDLIRGNVDTIILKVLYEGDRYGYDLIKQINSRGDGQWEIKQPTVYACLKRLEKQGFISSYWDSSESDGGRRKYYSLTDSGKEVFLKYKSEFERANALFGELITGGEPGVYIQPQDDYSDVEEEGYALPKRKPVRKPKKQEDRHVIDKEEPEITDATDAQTVYETEPETSDDGLVEPLPVPDENTFTPDKQPVNPAEQNEIEQGSARAALDPREIIDRYYAAETGESYFDAHKKSESVESEKREVVQSAPPVTYTAPPPAPVKPVAAEPVPVRPAPVAQTASKQIANTVPPAPPATIYTADEESEARREYQTVLGDLVDRFEVATPDIRTADNDVQSAQTVEQAATAAAERNEYGALGKVEQAVRELGNDVKIRNHNDSAKEYAKNNYYFSNRLWLMHYTVLCAAMFAVGLILFVTFVWGCGIRMKYDYILYIFAGLLPVAMILCAVTAYATNPDKRKRINVNYKVSMIIRTVIMIQVAVIVYCLNLIWGMPVGFSADYIPSLVLPCAYAIFIPISQMIFMNLLKSGNYADYRE